MQDILFIIEKSMSLQTDNKPEPNQTKPILFCYFLSVQLRLEISNQIASVRVEHPFFLVKITPRFLNYTTIFTFGP